MSSLRLTDLPHELQLHLLDFLDWQAVTSLRLASSCFANLIDIKALLKRHEQCTAALHQEELNKERQLQIEYWEAAEQAFLGYHSSSYTSSSLDPDLRAYGERYGCTYSQLPCYRCLRWLPSTTDEPHFASKSCFSRGRSVRSFNLGGRDALKRNCIDCGIRSGMYPPGSKVKHNVVCKRCGKLGEPAEAWTWRWSDPRKTWKVSIYCQTCCDHPDIVDLTIGMHMHEQRWKKYEDAMRRGKLYRLEKGQKLRAERGIVNRGHEKLTPITIMAGQRYCITVKEMRFCKCHPERGYDPLDDPTLPNL